MVVFLDVIESPFVKLGVGGEYHELQCARIFEGYTGTGKIPLPLGNFSHVTTQSDFSLCTF